MKETLGSREVERFLSGFHDIAPDHLSAYAGRLKHIARQGFPAGVASGRGNPAEYDADQLFQLLLVTQLTQYGVQPGRAMRLVSEAWSRLQGDVLRIWEAIDASQYSGTLELPAIFWRVPVEALRHMALPDRPYSPDAEDRLDTMDAEQAHAALDRRDYGIQRHAFIAADQMVEDALTQLRHQLGGHDALAAFMQGMTSPAESS